jgi:acetyl esterase/lipase
MVEHNPRCGRARCTLPRVPIGYLATVLLVACATLLALVPLRRPALLVSLSFRVGVVVNELPFLAFYWLLASTMLAFAQGDVDSKGGWAGAGIAAAATVGLAVVAWRGWRAEPAVAKAMDEGLGVGWRTAIDARLSAGLRTRRPIARILFAPFRIRRHDVERVANISYGDAGIENVLDVYRHRSHPAGSPTLIYLHGGGFRGGRKGLEARPLLFRLAGQGWVCISANYRLSPAARFPDHLMDVKKVIGWVREHGHEYGSDPAMLFVAGSSAGGHLASMAALTANIPAFQPGMEHIDTAVAAGISLSGYYGPLSATHRLPSTPTAYVGPDAPPVFLAHGSGDTLVPVESARNFAERLRSTSSQPVVYAELPGGQHSFDLFYSLRFDSVVDAIEAFAAWVRSRGTTQDV